MFCKATESGKEFYFICEPQRLSSVINKVCNVTGFSKSSEDEKQHIFISYDNKLYVAGISPETFVVMCLENVETNGNSSFGFIPKNVLGLIKNRKTMKFTYDGSRLNIQEAKGKYKASVVTMEITETQLPYINSRMKTRNSEQTIDPQTLERIRIGVDYADIYNVYNKEDKPLCHIQCTKSTLKIGSFDNHHFVQYVSSIETKDDFSLSISTDAFKLVDKFIAEEKETNANFSIRSNSFEVHSKNFIIGLPPIQSDSDSFNIIDLYVKGLKPPIGKFKFSSDGIATVNNMFTIARDDSRLTVIVNSETKKIGMSISTEEGSISDSFSSSVVELDKISRFEFKINPSIFADLFKKVSDKKDLPISLYAKQNKGSTSCFVIKTRPDENSKLLLLGTYYEK